MSKQRMINTKFWSDSWIRTLNPIDRYLFIYFLTNEHTNICGIYELPMDTLEHETGLKNNDLITSYFPKLKPKMYYYKNYVILTNFAKNQNLNNPSIVAGIQRELDTIPKEIYEKAISFKYRFEDLGGSRGVVGTLNLTKPNLTKEVETNVSSTPLKAKKVTSKTEFDFESILNDWGTKKNEYKVFHYYLTYRKIKLLSKAEVDRFTKTYYKSASIIKTYSIDRTKKVFIELQDKKGEDWSLWNVASEISNKKYE